MRFLAILAGILALPIMMALAVPSSAPVSVDIIGRNLNLVERDANTVIAEVNAILATLLTAFTKLFEDALAQIGVVLNAVPGEIAAVDTLAGTTSATITNAIKSLSLAIDELLRVALSGG